MLCSDRREIKRKKVRVRVSKEIKVAFVCHPTADLSLCCTCAALGSVVCMASHCYVYMYLSSH